MNIKKQSLLLMGLTIVITSSILTKISYDSQNEQLEKSINSKLLTVAKAAQKILPENYHSNIIDKASVAPADYIKLVDTWNTLCKDLELEYIWSLMRIDGKTVFTSGTATDKTLTIGQYATFFEEHTNPEIYDTVFSTGKVCYQTNDDKWGHIKAILTPHTDKHGRRYIVGASMKTSNLIAQRGALLNKCITATLSVLVFGFVLCYIFSGKLTKPIVELTKHADEISHGNFEINSVPNGPKEIKSLFNSINQMSLSIKEKISSLDATNNNLNDEIKARITTEEALRKSEKNLSITLNSIGDGVIATDDQGCITRMNPVAEGLTGWSLSDAKGKPLPEVFHIINAFSRKVCENPVGKVLATGKIVGLANHTMLISKENKEYHIADSGAPIRNNENEITGVVLVFQDVTEEYKLQDQLHQAQKLDSIGRLAGGVAHDFNNMLAGVMGASELIAKQLSEQKDVENHDDLMSLVELVQKSAGQASDLTRKLLDFSRKGQVITKPMNIHDSIDQAVQILNHTIDKRIEIDLKLNAEFSHLVGDPSQLQNAILNLGINSCDAMEKGGNFSVKTFNITLDETYSLSRSMSINPGDYIEIQVTDTGSGIKPEALDHIFEPFYTTKDVGEGTGLGLASAYGAVKEHNGHIDVHSKVGEGTTFHLFIPIDKTIQTEYTIKEVAPKKRSEGHCVLLAEDEELVREMSRRMLKRLNYRVIEAVDGIETMNKFHEHKNDIDAVLLDLIMPKMNGEECFKKIKEISPSTKVILCSGYSRDIAIEELMEIEDFQFIKKPFNYSELEQLLSLEKDEVALT